MKQQHPPLVRKQHLWLLLGLCLLLAGGTAYDMAQRGMAQQLWGHRPLLLFLAAWAAVVLAYTIGCYRSIRWPLLGLSTLSGVLLGLGFPGYLPWPLLMFVGFVPLLLVEERIAADASRPRGWSTFRHAYHAFILWNIISTYWVTNTALVAGLAAIMANSLLFCIPFMLFHATRRATPKLGYAALAAYWMAFEQVHLGWEMTWPWLTLGNAFAKVPAWVQWYEYSGVFGGSLWVLLLNLLAFHWLRRYQRGEGRQPLRLAQMGLLLALPILLSLLRYYTYTEQGPAVEVVVVQPNYEPHYQKFEVEEDQQVERYLQLSRQTLTADSRYLVYPETSFGYVEKSALEAYPAIQRLRALMTDYPQLKVVTGLNAYRDLPAGEAPGPAARERRFGNGQVRYYEVMNAAVQLSPEKTDVEWYLKSKLVPGPEIFPFKKILFFVEPLIERLDGTVAGLATQAQRSAFASSDGKVAPVICYESVFGDFSTGYIRAGAQAIFVMTNDGWWDDTPGHRQHLWFASLRAIETRRGVARSANTGISGFINQRGDIGQTLAYGQTGALRERMAFNQDVTFYVTWGDLIARIALFTSLLFLFNALAKGWLKSVKR